MRKYQRDRRSHWFIFYKERDLIVIANIGSPNEKPHLHR